MPFVLTLLCVSAFTFSTSNLFAEICVTVMNVVMVLRFSGWFVGQRYNRFPFCDLLRQIFFIFFYEPTPEAV